MADIPRDNIYGYGKVIQAIRAKIGPDESPQTWLAKELGVSRQACHFWASSDGIPRNHVAVVEAITGLSDLEIRPEDVATVIPGSIYDEITRQANAKRTTFTARLIAVLKLGLKGA